MLKRSVEMGSPCLNPYFILISLDGETLTKIEGLAF